MSIENQPLPPGMMFRSFMLIGGAYIVSFLLVCVAGFVIAKSFFPDSIAIINGDPAIYNSIMETEPEKVFPPEMLWMLLVVSAFSCAVLGYLVARTAPFGRFSHAVFFAAILFVHYLQLAIGAKPPLQTMLVLFMAASPVAALLGANFFLRKVPTEPESQKAS